MTRSIARLHDPERPSGQHRALVVESAHENVDALADLAQHVLGRHLAILEDELAGVEPRMPSLSSFCAVEKPLKPFSMRRR